MSTFNESLIDMDHFKDDVTVAEVRTIAEAAIKAADGDPQGNDLVMNMLAGGGPLVVIMIADLAKTVSALLDRLEAAQEASAA